MPGELADAEHDVDSFGLAPDLVVVAGSLRPELRHLTEDRDGAATACTLAQMLERGAHRDRVRVPGVVDQQAAARQLRLLGAPERELDLHGLLRRLDAERVSSCQRRRVANHEELRAR